MVATATNELPLTHVGSHSVDAVECWAAGLSGGTTLISIWSRGDVHMHGDKRCKKRHRGANLGHGVTGGMAFSLKIKASHAVSSQKCLIGP